ncbi:PEGA domain-containing protein [Patescibacteria group bacterium]|nr:PEGA domain-containing protein [Patescibacteria group bacterium]
MPIYIRRVIFWIFVLIFFISAPALVLYTAGYRYSLSSGVVTRTGVLSITTNPRGAEIYLDGESTGIKSPDVINRVMPGTYTIELRKDGYRPWTGQVDIKSGQATTLQGIYLFLDQDANLLFDKETSSLAVDPLGDTIAYTIIEGGWQELWMYQLEKNIHMLLNQTMDAGENETQLTWSANGSYLSVYDPTTSTVALYNKDAVKLPIPIEDEILAVSWHPSADQLLLLTTQYGITQLDVQTMATHIFSQTDDTSVLLDASILRITQGTTYTEVAQYVNGEKETLALLPKSSYNIQQRDGAYLILSDSIGQIYLIEIHQDQPILLQKEATAYDWNKNADMLVFTNGYELSVYDAKTHSTELITRQSTKINSVAWHPSANIVFVQDSALNAYEIYAIANQRFVTNLLNNTDIKELWVSKNGNNIYFYGQQNGAYGVYQLKLANTLDSIF